MLLSATGITLGFVLPALLGLGGAWLWARRRRRPLTRGAAWLGSIVGAAAGFAIALAAVFATLPPGSLGKGFAAAERAAEAESAKPVKTPEWLRRVSPEAARAAARPDPFAERMVGSRAFLVWAGVTGAVITCALFAAVVGSVSWGGATLVGYALTGRWLPRVESGAAGWSIDEDETRR